MTKKADTWMPWYVADYLADTAHLTTEQHGAYCLMLMAAWKRDGSLPKDDTQLAAVSRLSANRWKTHKTVLLEFFIEEPTRYVHKRVTQERLKAQENSNKKATAGAKGGAAKAKNASKSDGTGDGKPIADGVAKVVADAKQTPTPSPSPLPLPSEEFQGAAAPLSPGNPAPADGGELVLTPPEPKEPPVCPHKRLLALYREKLPELPQPRGELWEGTAGAEAMAQRWKFLLTKSREDGSRYATTTQEGLDWFSRFFEAVAQADLLMGRRSKWRADLAWLMKRENFIKVVQGNYDKEPA